jgi:hypothetical protein
MGNPIDKYRQNAVLEGGKSGSGGSSALETATKVGGPAALTFVGGIGGSQMIRNAREKREQEASEAADEIKREKRGVEKTPTDRARDDAREIKMQEQTDKAADMASKNMAKGGTASSRADGCCVKGKTRGKMM